MSRLLFLCHGAGNGGAERVITTLADAFANKGHIIMLVTTNQDHNDYDLNDSILRERVLSQKTSVLTRTLDRVLKLRNCIKDFNPDCIISFSSIPNLQAIVADFGIKNRLIVSERTDPNRYPTSFLGRLLRKILYPAADIIVFQTVEAQSYFSGTIQRKSVIIENPIRNNIPISKNVGKEKKIVGIGSLSEQKNWMVALKAAEIFFEKFPEYILDIFGEGPEFTQLQEYIYNSAILRERVNLRGFSNDVLRELETASLYISSSIYEGISNSMLESLAMGIPTICTDCPVGGARMVIESGNNGILVPVNSAEKLAAAMISVISNDSLSKKLSANAIAVRYRFSEERIIREWEKIVVTN